MCQAKHSDSAAAGESMAVTGSARGCACARDGAAPNSSAAVRWVEAAHDLDFPPVPLPSQRVFEIAGEIKLRELVRRHHLRLRVGAIGHLFPSHPAEFDAGVEKTADFVVEACGGAANFSARFGHTCMRTRHYGFMIDEAAREIWLAGLWQAFDEVAFPWAVRQELWDWAEALSIRIVNRRTGRAQPRRHPFSAADITLAQYGIPPRRPVACVR